MMTYKEIYNKGRECLRAAGIQEAELDARLLLEWVCGTSRSDLLAHGEKEITSRQEKDYIGFIKLRSNRVPLQHITGVQEFMGLTFKVNQSVLIPRQDTECLVEEVMKNLHDGMHVLDMCTGSGCILLSLLYYSNRCHGVGVDISRQALKIAEENAERLAVREKEDVAAEFLESNLFEKVEGQYDVIVSNPPYIRSSVIETLMDEVKCHEPLCALDGMEDGLFFYREISREAKKHLHRGGSLFYEIGFDQGKEVKAIMEQEGYQEVAVIKDLAGLDRVVMGIVRQ